MHFGRLNKLGLKVIIANVTENLNIFISTKEEF